MKHYLDIAALEERLQIARSTLYSWAEQGRLPHLKLGRLLRFDPDEIETWLQAHHRKDISTPILPRPQHGADGVDLLIARAKPEAYSAASGDQTKRQKGG